MKLNLLKNALSETKSKKKELLSQVKVDNTYIKNSEIARIKIENEKKRAEERLKKRKLNLSNQEIEISPKKQKLNEEEDLTNIMPSRIQMMKLLRQYKEPITLFGETDLDRWTRLKIVEKKQSELVNDQQNLFQKNMLEEEVARQERESIFRSSMSDNKQESKIDLSEPLLDYESFIKLKNSKDIKILKTDLKSDGKNEKSKSDKESKPDSKTDDEHSDNIKTQEDYVYYMLQRLCEEWRVYLNQRSEQEQKSAIGKREYGNWKQTTQYLEPLYERLRKKTLDHSQLKFFTKIFSNVAQKEYVLANDQYLQLAIGNVAWPMGVENIGIHARSSREKISSVNVAHILNDDTQRKYIQCVKRLMTFAQKKYPTIPSKMVA